MSGPPAGDVPCMLAAGLRPVPAQRNAGTETVRAYTTQEMRVGLIGFGAIGRQVSLGLAGAPGAVLVRQARVGDANFVYTLQAFLAARPEVVIEAASPDALARLAVPILESSATLIAASGSALRDPEFRARLVEACANSGGRVFVPAGALAGLDALGSAAAGGLERVRLRITDPHPDQPAFTGDAWEGVHRFPTRLNVAAAAALVAGQAVELTVERGTEHELRLDVSGTFGEFSATLRPRPRADSLSHIVALSLLATLQRCAGPGHLAVHPRTDSSPD
jgi:aspartate dehydrogenase